MEQPTALCRRPGAIRSRKGRTIFRRAILFLTGFEWSKPRYADCLSELESRMTEGAQVFWSDADTIMKTRLFCCGLDESRTSSRYVWGVDIWVNCLKAV